MSISAAQGQVQEALIKEGVTFPTRPDERLDKGSVLRNLGLIWSSLHATAMMGVDLEPFWVAYSRFMRGEPISTTNGNDMGTEFDRILKEQRG